MFNMFKMNFKTFAKVLGRSMAHALVASPLLFAALPAFAEYNQAGIPDSAEIRTRVQQEWLEQPYAALKGKSAEHSTDAIGNLFEIRMEDSAEGEAATEYAIIVCPETYSQTEFIDGESRQVQKIPHYYKDSAGSWILYKEKASGKPLRIEWHFSYDEDVYLMFVPSGHKTFANLIVCSYYAARSVPLGIDFKNLYTMSFQEVYNLTKKPLPWYKVDFSNNDYTEVKKMIAIIRQKLPSLKYAEYAACDERDNVLNILTGAPYKKEEVDYSALLRNAPAPTESEDDSKLLLGEDGFVKWIVDGIIRSVTGQNSSLAEMLEPTDILDSAPAVTQQNKFSATNKKRTLDLCRNLAAKAFVVRSPRGIRAKSGGSKNDDWKKFGVDVNVEPFVSRLVTPSKAENTAGYVEGTGYSVDELRGMLYVLACTEPGWFYIGAIREPAIKENTMKFDHCAAFFSYFDSNRRLVCRVFQKGEVLSLEDFIKKYPKCFVHLERVKSFPYFKPY